MKATSILALITAAALGAGCNDAAQPAGNKTTPESSGNPATAPADYLKSAADSQKRAVKTIDKTAINKAIETFYVQEGRFPKDLYELVEKGFMKKIPEPPFGMELRYDTNSGIVTIKKKE
jgi:hypothetical protein